MSHPNNKSLDKKINKILHKYQLRAETDLSTTIIQTTLAKENNVCFFCQNQPNSQKTYFFKYQIQKSANQTLQSRRQFNLVNEINFYQTAKSQPFKKLVLPKLFHSGLKPNPWLITEKIDLKNTYSFPKNSFFSENSISEKYIPILIDGLSEFHQQKFPPKKFHRQKMSDLIKWFQFLNPSFTGVLSPIAAFVPRIMIKHEKLWNQNCRTLIHGDLVADTYAFSPANKLILFDFEKVQISHPAFDFSSFFINPRNKQWNQQLFNRLIKKYPDPSFKILLYLSGILRLCHLLGNFKSGRLDHVFLPIIGSKKFLPTKKLYLRLWLREILRLIDQINKIAP